MNLSPSDIKRLYGKRFFLVPEPEAAEAAEENENPSLPQTEETEKPVPLFKEEWLLEGPGIIWKMKPAAKLAIILRKQEFTDRSLTNLLKQAILDAGIDTQLVGFGILDDQATKCNLQDIQVNLALICDEMETEWPQMPVMVGNGQVWLTRQLGEISESEAFSGQLAAHLSAIRNFL